MSHHVSKKELSLGHQQIDIHIASKDIHAEFETAVKQHAKQMDMPGFRKGMVPSGLIKKSKGNTILTQVLFQRMEKQLEIYMKEQQLEIVGQPMMTDFPQDIQYTNFTADYVFSFELGMKPAFELADLTTHTVTAYQVQVGNEMVEEEIATLQRRFGELADEEEKIKSIEDIIHLDFRMWDAKTKTVREDAKNNVLLVKYFEPKEAKKLIGKKKNDKFVITLNKAFEGKELAFILKDLGIENEKNAGERAYELTLTKVGHIRVAELNEALFKKIFPENPPADATALKERIQEGLEHSWSTRTEDAIHNDIYLFWTSKTKMDLPEDFLKKWYTQQENYKKADTEEKEKEQLEKFMTQLRWTLILDKISQKEKFEIKQEAIIEEVRREVTSYNGQQSPEEQNKAIMQLLNKQDYLYRVQQRLLNHEVFSWAAQQVKREQKKVNVEDFQKYMEQLNA